MEAQQRRNAIIDLISTGNRKYTEMPKRIAQNNVTNSILSGSEGNENNPIAVRNTGQLLNIFTVKQISEFSRLIPAHILQLSLIS